MGVDEVRLRRDHLAQDVYRHRRLAHRDADERLQGKPLGVAWRKLEDAARLVPDAHQIAALELRLRERDVRGYVGRIARDRRLDLRLALGCRPARRQLARHRTARLARLRRLVHEESEEEEGRGGADAPEEAAHSGESGSGAGRRSRLRAAPLAKRRHRRRIEREEHVRRIELELVPLPRELRRGPLASRVLHLAELLHERISLGGEILRMQRGGRLRRHRGGARTRAGVDEDAGREPDREGDDGGEPVHGGSIHGADPVLGGPPPGHPWAGPRPRRTASASRGSSGTVPRASASIGALTSAAPRGFRSANPMTAPPASRNAAGPNQTTQFAPRSGGRSRTNSPYERPKSARICSWSYPAASLSRTSSFMLRAMVAGESATDRPWHTGQRRRPATSSVRASSCGPASGVPAGWPIGVASPAASNPRRAIPARLVISYLSPSRRAPRWSAGRAGRRTSRRSCRSRR